MLAKICRQSVWWAESDAVYLESFQSNASSSKSMKIARILIKPNNQASVILGILRRNACKIVAKARCMGIFNFKNWFEVNVWLIRLIQDAFICQKSIDHFASQSNSIHTLKLVTVKCQRQKSTNHNKKDYGDGFLFWLVSCKSQHTCHLHI